MTAKPLQRLRGVVGDALIVLPWVVVATAVGVVLRAVGAAPTTPAAWDLVAALTLVAPVVVTHAVLEARTGTTPGKRWAGTAVMRLDGRRPTLARTLLRSGVKFAPWQLAHTAVFRLVDGSEEVVWLVVAGLAQLAVVASALLVGLRADRRALHDLAAGTRVVAVRAAGTTDSGVWGSTA